MNPAPTAELESPSTRTNGSAAGNSSVAVDRAGVQLDSSEVAAFTDQLERVAEAGLQGALPAEDSLYYDAASMAPLNAVSAVCHCCNFPFYTMRLSGHILHVASRWLTGGVFLCVGRRRPAPGV